MCTGNRIELFKKYTGTQFAYNPLVVMLFGGGVKLEACPDEYFRLLFITKKQKLKNLYHHNKTRLSLSFPGWGADLRTDDTNVSELVRIANRRSRLDRLGLKAKLCERGANPRQGWDGVILTHLTLIQKPSIQ